MNLRTLSYLLLIQTLRSSGVYVMKADAIKFLTSTYLCLFLPQFLCKECKLFSKLKATNEHKTHNVSVSERVQMQYQDMPYPAFNSDKMERERKHYNDNSKEKTIFQFMPTETLSMINHYLYQVNYMLVTFFIVHKPRTLTQKTSTWVFDN